jgi:hypothetical protein
MIRLLQEGDTGYGLLVEYDAGFVERGMNDTLFVNESLQIKDGEPIFINCVLQKWGVKNKNGRIYPKDVLINQVSEYDALVKDNSAPSEADHPESSIISLHNISHLITKMWWGKGDKENVLYGQIQLIVSPGFIKYGIVSVIGDKILLYLQNKMKLGISSRGVGSLKEVSGENIVQDDFELIGFDLVSTPSTPGAFLFPGMAAEQMGMEEEYKKKNGIYLKENTKISTTLDRFLL